ncbi:family 43 glycosylhydrolase [Aurantiacibacter suaedae]|uniref:glycoside hydrolase family 43 protein n=1 Tax=Aurantiacibacter suaedae TaxID=2545755 RepID=UPI0010F6EB2A|nr:family 43 glycosylhydrolase [Aurantiacibacter suaedae]
MTYPHTDRRWILRASILAAATSVTPGALRAASPCEREPLINPIIFQRADPHILRHGSSPYYFTASVPEYDRIILRHAPTIGALGRAEEKTLWQRPVQGEMAGHIWAPEIHRIDGRWLIYFAAGNSDDVFHIRTYVLACAGDDPMADEWSVLGQLETPWDTFNLDATSFHHRGVDYLCWAQREPGIETNSNLYLAPLASPTTFAAPPARLTVPTLDWEIQGFKVNEGAAFLAHGDKVFLTYSASATDDRYAMGLLSADADADLMAPESWTKSATPVFESAPEHCIFGPGHNSFTTDECGRDVLVYHARDYQDIEGDPLYDPNRHARVQRFGYDHEGFPVFGKPVRSGPLRQDDLA